MYCSMLCVKVLFWYMEHNWYYRILAIIAQTIVKLVLIFRILLLVMDEVDLDVAFVHPF